MTDVIIAFILMFILGVVVAMTVDKFHRARAAEREAKSKNILLKLELVRKDMVIAMLRNQIKKGGDSED